MQYFQEHFADNPACTGGQEESDAEWLVRITTQVRCQPHLRIQGQTSVNGQWLL